MPAPGPLRSEFGAILSAVAVLAGARAGEHLCWAGGAGWAAVLVVAAPVVILLGARLFAGGRGKGATPRSGGWQGAAAGRVRWGRRTAGLLCLGALGAVSMARSLAEGRVVIVNNYASPPPASRGGSRCGWRPIRRVSGASGSRAGWRVWRPVGTGWGRRRAAGGGSGWWPSGAENHGGPCSWWRRARRRNGSGSWRQGSRPCSSGRSGHWRRGSGSGAGATPAPPSTPTISSGPAGRRRRCCGRPTGSATGCWPAEPGSTTPTGRWWPGSSSATTATCRRGWRPTSGRPACRTSSWSPAPT